MRYKALAVLLSAGVAFAFPSSVYADVLDSQIDDSAEATRPSADDPSYIYSDGFYLAAGYVPSTDFSFSGLRLRVNSSDSGNYLCPAGDIYTYFGTSTPDLWNSGRYTGSIVVSTTTPDANGDCDYTTRDIYGSATPIALSSGNYYVFLMTAGGDRTHWVSMSGKDWSASTTQDFFGFRPATHNDYRWGTTGLERPYFQFFDTAPPQSAPPAQVAQSSNVLFLPGIEGSRLYEGTGCGKDAEEKLWEPYEGLPGLARGVGDRKVHDLELTTAGTSACSDIYAKAGDIIDKVNDSAIYDSFIQEMGSLKADGTINDWKPVAYDWRLSLDDLLTKGAQHGERIYYEEATSTPYIEQTLRSLAATSKTGKVTIIAHSNGGLVTKALLKKLGDEASRSLVDKIIMVGVPQSGTPLDIGSMLVGYDAGIYSKYGIKIVSNVAARSLAQNSPMAYHLLPSGDYFWSAGGDGAHPIIQFNGFAYANEELTYGHIIKDIMAMDDFLLAKEGSRTKPKSSDLKSAEILNSALIDYANLTHSTLDTWIPPSGIQVSQIAGWGVDTVGGIDFYTASSTLFNFLDQRRRYRPIFIEDGDGTVPAPSALLMASSTNVRNYWVDLRSYNKIASIKRNHADLFELTPLEDFIKNIILDSGTTTLPQNITVNRPVPISEEKKLTFILHTPVSFKITDGGGSPTIPGLSYGELGGTMYITVPQGGQYQVTIQGQESGLLDLDMQERVGGTVTASSTIESIPVTGSTLINLTISGGGLDTASPVTVDQNGDGQKITTIAPVVGETVIFPEPPAEENSMSEPPPITGGGTGGDSVGSIPIAATTAQEVPAVSTSTQPIAPVPTVVATSSDQVSSSSASVAIVPSHIRIAVQRAPKKVPAPAPKGTVSPVSLQTASVYAVVHQPIFTKVLIALSDGLHKFWVTIKRLI